MLKLVCNVSNKMQLMTLVGDTFIQSNLVNSKSSGLEVLFRIISSSNYRAVDIKYMTPKNDNQIFILSNISFGHVKETSQGDISFLHPKCYYRQLLK